MQIARRTARSIAADRIFGHAAELGFYFLFSLFPALFCAGSILGLAARSAHQISVRLLAYMALLIPPSAMGEVMKTFNQTAAASTSNKITVSLLGAIWSASVGISALQDTLNDVYKIEDSRSYLVARFYAIVLTLLVGVLIALSLGAMFGGDLLAGLLHRHMTDLAGLLAAAGIRLLTWAIAAALLVLVFAAIYYWAPDWRKRRWRWFTPGAAAGILGWLVVSVGFRIYLHFFNTFSVTYGSLGAVIILMMWFYISGMMLLIGAEINSEIEATAVEQRIRARPEAPIAHPEQAA